VRSWTGWHRHAVLAAEAFLSVLRYQVELLGELNSSIFFSSGWVGSLVAFKAVRLSAQSCRVEAMGLEVTVSSFLVCRVDPPLVFGADIIKLSLATIITVNVPKLPNISTTVVLG